MPHKPALLKAVCMTELPASARPDTVLERLQINRTLLLAQQNKGCSCAWWCVLRKLAECPASCAGLYEGIPTRVCPHTTSGRADYFG